MQIGLIQSQEAAAAAEPRELNALLTGTLSLSVVAGDDSQTDVFGLTCGRSRSCCRAVVERQSRRVQTSDLPPAHSSNLSRRIQMEKPSDSHTCALGVADEVTRRV